MEGQEPTGSSLTVRLATNTIIQAVGSVVGAAISFFTFVAVTRGLGPDAFGDFTAATVYLFIPVVLADIGLSAAVLREISADPDRTEPAMRASLPLRALISAAAIGTAVVVALVIPFDSQTKEAIVIASFGAFLTLLTLALLPVLQAQLRMQWAVGANLVGRAATLGLTLAALGAGLGFRSYVIAYVVGIAVTFVLHVWAVARLVRITPVYDTAYWRSLTTGALALGIAISLSLVYFRIDTVLLALLRSSEEVGYYGAAYKFIELVVLVPAAVGVSVFPPLARFLATGDPRTTGLVQKSFDILLAAAVPPMALMLAYPEEIIEFTAGAEFAAAADALRLLAPVTLFAFVNAVLWRVLMASDRDRILLAVAVGILGLNVALNLLLVPEYGFEAAALITSVSEALVTIPIAYYVYLEGRLPNLGYAPTVAAASAVMVAAILFVPGPAVAVGALASLLYLIVLLVLPGTGRDVVRQELVPALRARR